MNGISTLTCPGNSTSGFLTLNFAFLQDVVAMTSTPLPGYTVSVGTKKEYLNPDLVFVISHASQKGYYFLVDDTSTRNRFVELFLFYPFH